MDSHGLALVGKLVVEKLSSLPTWTASDEGRVVYDLTTRVVYYGTNTKWVAQGGVGRAFAYSWFNRR